MHCNENENPVNGHGGLTLQNLIKCTYQMCWKYPTATKVCMAWHLFVCTTTQLLKCIHDPPVWFSVLSTQAVRELPAIKYAKRLGNQVLSSLSYLEASCRWFDKDRKLVCPLEDMTNDEETRPYLEIVSLRDHVLIASSPFTYPGIPLSLLYLEKCWWQSWKTVQSPGYAFPQPPSGVDWKPK